MTKLILFSVFTIIALGSFTTTDAAVLKGTVINSNTQEPVAFATIKIQQSSQTIMTNEDGSFLLHVDKGDYNLTCSHIAYYTFKSEIEIDSDTLELKILLNPSLIELPSIHVYERNYDAAQVIIREAIGHKDEILAKLASYQFDAYTKTTIWDASNLDSLKPMYLTETELIAYWKYPSEYKEIITARKGSANIESQNIIISIGEIPNFNDNRIKLGASPLVSPTAEDALEYYNYYLLDTLFYDTLAVYLLEIEPINNTTPLFVGTIQINANSYEIMGVDLTINEGLDSPYLKKLRLVQEYNLFADEFWMPTTIQYDGIIDIPIPIFPTISFSYIAGLQNYQFEKEYGDTIFNGYILEVDKNADDFDSTQWLANRFIPLTIEEEKAYAYIDSVEQNKPLLKKLLPIIPGILMTIKSNKDIFHFNRVEGAYLGGKYNFRTDNDQLVTKTKIGYAFDAELWQHDNSIKYFLSNKHRFSLQASYHDNLQTRKTLNSPTNGNATTVSLLKKVDPYDYYREKGFSLTASIAPIKQTTFSLSYNNFKQFSINNNSNYSIRHKDNTYRENLPITDGNLNSLQFSLQYDSYKKIKIKGKELSVFSYPFTLIRIGAEISDSSFLQSDFTYKTLYAQLYTSRQLLGIGISSIGIYGTTKLSGQLPPQRYTTMDFGSNFLDRDMIFKTLHFTNFTATELLSIYYCHDFGTKLFKRSKLPLIKKIPFSFSIHGGAFWSELSGNDYNSYDELTNQTGNNPYSELGFSIGRLPLLLKLSATWQLSSYNTSLYSIRLGFDFK